MSKSLTVKGRESFQSHIFTLRNVPSFGMGESYDKNESYI